PPRARPMTRRLVQLLLASLLVLTVRGKVAAQQAATDLLAQGMRAYQSLDYDQAAAILRRGLTRTVGDTLSTAERLQALTYLGASELFRDRRDAALAAFRQIAATDPRYRPSEIIFPPQVTGVFGEARQQTKTVFFQVQQETEFRAKTEHFTARLVASSPHDVAVTITTGDGKLVRRLYDGPIADSLAVTWDGLTEERNPVQSGRYTLRVAPRAAGAGQLARQLSLEILRAKPDTQPWPAGAGLAEGGGGTGDVGGTWGWAMKTLVLAAAGLPLLGSAVGAQQRLRATGWGDGAIVQLGTQILGARESQSGPVFGGEGRLGLGPVTLGVGYLEGRLQPGTSGTPQGRDL